MSVVYLAATFGGGKAPPAAVDVPPVGRRGAFFGENDGWDASGFLYTRIKG